MDTITNNTKVLHDTFVVKVMGSLAIKCKGAAWNFLCWSKWLKSCMRTYPTINHSWTQIRMESCKGNTGRYYKTSLFWPLPIGWLSIWWISTIALDLIILLLVTEHYFFWWKVARKQCILFQLLVGSICCLIIDWFANWVATWFIRWITHWLQ